MYLFSPTPPVKVLRSSLEMLPASQVSHADSVHCLDLDPGRGRLDRSACNRCRTCVAGCQYVCRKGGKFGKVNRLGWGETYKGITSQPTLPLTRAASIFDFNSSIDPRDLIVGPWPRSLANIVAT